MAGRSAGFGASFDAAASSSSTAVSSSSSTAVRAPMPPPPTMGAGAADPRRPFTPSRTSTAESESGESSTRRLDFFAPPAIFGAWARAGWRLSNASSSSSSSSRSSSTTRTTDPSSAASRSAGDRYVPARAEFGCAKRDSDDPPAMRSGEPPNDADLGRSSASSSSSSNSTSRRLECRPSPPSAMYRYAVAPNATIASTPPQMIERRSTRDVRSHDAEPPPREDPLLAPRLSDARVRPAAARGTGGLGVDGPGCQLSPSSQPASSSSSSPSLHPPDDFVVAGAGCDPCVDPADDDPPADDERPANERPSPDELVDVLGAMALASRQASSPSSASDASQPSVAAIVPGAVRGAASQGAAHPKLLS